jgi:GNAT superfamily N-acetyltransferase
MDACSIILEPDPTDLDKKTIIHGLVRFNSAHVEAENWQELVLSLCDPNGTLQGGLLGYTHWQWLFVSHLWIAESVRGQGYGQSLLMRAEEEALSRGCHHAHLDTFDFQARGFYERLGYTVFGQLDDYPLGHARYFLRKTLSSL